MNLFNELRECLKEKKYFKSDISEKDNNRLLRDIKSIYYHLDIIFKNVVNTLLKKYECFDIDKIILTPTGLKNNILYCKVYINNDFYYIVKLELNKLA